MGCRNLIMQGDQYLLPITIKYDGEYIDVDEVDVIQFTVGSLVKNYTNDLESVVQYDSEKHQFGFPITQTESFAMNGPQDCQIRIKFINGDIQGKAIGQIEIQFSKTKVAL